MSPRAVTSATGGTAARRAAKETTKDAPKDAPIDAEIDTAEVAPEDAPAAPPAAVVRHQLDPDALVALEEERDFLLGSLRDLEEERASGDIDDTDYVTLKDDYTARAADVIRSIEHRQDARAVADRDRRSRRSPWRTALAVAAVVVLAVVAGVLVAQASGRRSSGDSVTGDIRSSSRDLLAQAQEQFGQGEVLEAIQTYDEVLAMQPANAEALTYKGWLLYRASAAGQGGGQVSDEELKRLQDRALDSLGRAVAADATYADAHVFRAIIFRDLGRPAEAKAELDQVRTDQIPDFMQTMVEQLRTSVSGEPTSGETTDATSGGTTGGSTPSGAPAGGTAPR